MDLARMYRQWYEDRQRARTDLFFLSREVLQYPDISSEVHGPILQSLQKFSGGTDFVNDKGQWIDYRPEAGLWDLEGPRDRLYLDPRGHLKTTIITISHTIQWVINYSDVRVLLSMATGDQVTRVMSEILNHFRFNEKFRFLFPEYCPPAKSAKDFGNMEAFTVPCRKRKWLKEPTVSTCSVGKVVAGGHYEVEKHSDLVDKENIKTPNQIQEVIGHFKAMNYLLERGGNPPRKGWRDVEGTRYDFSELYGWLLELNERREQDKSGLQDELDLRKWQAHIRAARVPDDHTGKILWPVRFSHEDLDDARNEDPYLYAANMLNQPVPQGSGLCSREKIVFVPRKIMKQIPMHWHMTVDLAGMDADSTGDYIAFNIHGFDRDGRMNVVEILAGRFETEEVIDFFFEYCKAYPQIQDIKVEREAHWRTLAPFLKREQEKRVQSGKWKYLPPLIDLRRDNRTGKKERIAGLRPWFQAGLIRFAEEIHSKLETVQEITRFSKTSSYHDDVLDTLADAMQNRDGGVIGDILPDAQKEPLAPFHGLEKFGGFDPVTGLATWTGDEMIFGCDPRTGL